MSINMYEQVKCAVAYKTRFLLKMCFKRRTGYIVGCSKGGGIICFMLDEYQTGIGRD